MKNLLFVFLIIAISTNSYGQFECSVIGGETLRTGNITNSSDFIPDNSTPMKYIRVNIHFMLRSPDHADYPGNFTMTDDGDGNTDFTGYNYAEELINTANLRMASNHKMNMLPANTTAVIARKYRYVLNGVFFHEDNNHYFFDSSPHGPYGENKGESINVFFNNRVGGGSISGHANMSGNRYVEIRATWQRYINDKANGIGSGDGLSVSSYLLNHEIGHNLSLHHTIRGATGNCYNVNDYCSDTPTLNEMLNQGFTPCDNCWGAGPNCSNNNMDYSGGDAITPEQLGRVHWTIENELEDYKTCSYISSSVHITDFTNNKAFIGENVLIPSGTSITVNDKEALYINAKEFVISGELKIGHGSIFSVNTIPICN